MMDDEEDEEEEVEEEKEQRRHPFPKKNASSLVCRVFACKEGLANETLAQESFFFILPSHTSGDWTTTICP